MPGDVGVASQNVSVVIPTDHVIVKLLGTLGDPARRVDSQLDAADGGIVPQESIAAIGDQKRDGNLGIALFEFNDAALLIQAAMLVLAKPVESFAFLRLEPGFDVKQASAAPLKVAIGRSIIGRILRFFEKDRP